MKANRDVQQQNLTSEICQTNTDGGMTSLTPTLAEAGHGAAAKKEEVRDLIELLVDLGKKRQEIISQIAVAVQRQDRDEVFKLAKKLVGEI